MTSLISSRLLRAVAVTACLAVAGMAVQSSAFAAKSKSKTKTCNIKKSPKYPNKNPGGYFTSLKVRSVSCTSGKKLMTAYYKCRRKKGQSIQGRCKQSKVNGLKCKESRPKSGRRAGVEFNARVTCTKGSKRVTHTYQQNL